ncbi:MAG: hypothetical protein ABJD38_07890, partial [Aurantimonas coralicida]
MSQTKSIDQLSDDTVNEIEEALREDFEAGSDDGATVASGQLDQPSAADRTDVEFSFDDFERQISETAGELRTESAEARPATGVRRASLADFVAFDTPTEEQAPRTATEYEPHTARPAPRRSPAPTPRQAPPAASRPARQPAADVPRQKAAPSPQPSPAAAPAREHPAAQAAPRPETAERRPEPSEAPRAYSQPAANDEERRTSVMADALLSRRASMLPIWIGAAVSAAWVGIVGYISYDLYGSDIATLSNGIADPFRQSELAVMAAVLVIPVLLIMAFAVMVRRSADMRLMSRSMAEVALRLAEPESIATERVMSVGQAVRREVAALGEGVERALARTAELENVVHNEVSSLERAYADNEAKIRGLVNDLGAERDAMLSH